MQISLALKWKRKSPLLAFGDCHLSRASFQFEMWCFGEGRPPSRWRQCSERLHEAHSAADVSPVLVRRGQVRGNCHGVFTSESGSGHGEARCCQRPFGGRITNHFIEVSQQILAGLEWSRRGRGSWGQLKFT